MPAGTSPAATTTRRGRSPRSSAAGLVAAARSGIWGRHSSPGWAVPPLSAPPPPPLRPMRRLRPVIPCSVLSIRPIGEDAMSPDAKVASRFRGPLASERNSADLYSGLADAATGERREVLTELAAVERRHAAHWATRHRGLDDSQRP